MRIAHLLGWLLLLIAAAIFIPEATASGAFVMETLGALWHRLGASSLEAVQTSLQANLPDLWDPVMTTLLAIPAALFFAVPGGVLLLLPRRYGPPRQR